MRPIVIKTFHSLFRLNVCDVCDVCNVTIHTLLSLNGICTHVPFKIKREVRLGFGCYNLHMTKTYHFLWCICFSGFWPFTTICIIKCIVKMYSSLKTEEMSTALLHGVWTPVDYLKLRLVLNAENWLTLINE